MKGTRPFRDTNLIFPISHVGLQSCQASCGGVKSKYMILSTLMSKRLSASGLLFATTWLAESPCTWNKFGKGVKRRGKALLLLIISVQAGYIITSLWVCTVKTFPVHTGEGKSFYLHLLFLYKCGVITWNTLAKKLTSLALPWAVLLTLYIAMPSALHCIFPRFIHFSCLICHCLISNYYSRLSELRPRFVFTI